MTAESAFIRAQDAPPPATPSEELPAGSEVLAGGPVHEAFAKPVTIEAQAAVVVPQQPPQNLQEVPPAERPAGAGIVWVPGYWAWDAQRNDFIWVSGCWRNAPPSTYWVPGHWLEAGGGWEWIGGFWKPISAQSPQEMEYLPAPPAPIDIEAPGPPPLVSQVWVPGCWYWDHGQYVPRRGYWVNQQIGWVWVPSHHVWTPRGYIFIQGHWDHDMDDRGVLFCPAYFPRAVRVQAGFVFSPGVCVDLGVLRLNLFVYPRFHHYFFGDCYDDSFVRLGIVPWYRCQTVHTWYDPIFVYDRWHYQQSDPHWAANLAHGYDQRRANRDLRPARTVAEVQARMERLPANRRPERALVEPVKNYVVSQNTHVKFERITVTERQQIATKAADVHGLREQRGQWEGQKQAQAAPETRRSVASEPARKEERPAPAPVKESRAEPAHNAERAVAPYPVKAEPVRKEERPETAPVSTKAAKPPVMVPPREVRVQQPEREVVSATPRTPQPEQSRYIPKQAPGHPAPEQPHLPPGRSSSPPGHDSQNRPDKGKPN